MGFKQGDAGVIARFQRPDGEVREEEGAVPIGADGIPSAVRAALHTDDGGIRWNGIAMWRGAVDGPAGKTPPTRWRVTAVYRSPETARPRSERAHAARDTTGVWSRSSPEATKQGARRLHRRMTHRKPPPKAGPLGRSPSPSLSGAVT